jgi:hypothetical protein
MEKIPSVSHSTYVTLIISGKQNMHTTEPSVPEPSSLEVEIAIGNMKIYESSGTNQVPEELI